MPSVLVVIMLITLLLQAWQQFGRCAACGGTQLQQRLSFKHVEKLPKYVTEERLLRTLAEECARREDTIIYIGGDGGMVVDRHINTT